MEMENRNADGNRNALFPLCAGVSSALALQMLKGSYAQAVPLLAYLDYQKQTEPQNSWKSTQKKNKAILSYSSRCLCVNKIDLKDCML